MGSESVCEYLSPEKMAEVFDLNKQTLAHMRCQGRGPPYFKLGRLIRYRKTDVEAWFQRHTVRTADQP